MVDVTPMNWLGLWVTFCFFMIFDFIDLWQKNNGYFLTMASVIAAFVSCMMLIVIRNNTIKIEHALLNDQFMSFHLSHGIFSRCMCSCCFSATKIHEAHQKAIIDKMFESKKSRGIRRKIQVPSSKTDQDPNAVQENLEVARKISLLNAAREAEKFIKREAKDKKNESFAADGNEIKSRDCDTDFMSEILSNRDNETENEDKLGDLPGQFIHKKKVKTRRASIAQTSKIAFKTHTFFRQVTKPTEEVDPIKLHRFDTHQGKRFYESISIDHNILTKNLFLF
jgi:hypothetical protein